MNQFLAFADNPGTDSGGAQEVVEGTIDLLSIVMTAGVALVIGLIISFLIVGILRLIGRRQVFIRLLVRRISKPTYVTWAVWGARTGLVWGAQDSGADKAVWFDHVDHAMIIAIILGVTWLVASAIQTVEDMANYHFRNAKDQTQRGRIAMQTQLLRRLAQVIVVIAGVASVALTFPSARVAMTSLLGAAGVASVVASLAAQTTLGNVFAGLQLAMSDAIRVGDLVLIPGLESTKEQGRVEEITLTYVVLQIWDDRRIIVPSSEFTTQKFENWTRRKTDLVGIVLLQLDFSAPVVKIRAKVDDLLSKTELWDGKTANVQVTDSTDMSMTVRVVASAEDSGKLWDLKCYLREELIEWLNTEAPHAWPRRRIQDIEVQRVEEDLSGQEVAELAEELANIAGHDLGKGPSSESTLNALKEQNVQDADKETSDDPVHRLRLEAARQRSKREQHKQKKRHQEPGDDHTRVIRTPIVDAVKATDDQPESFKPRVQRKRRNPVQWHYHDADSMPQVVEDHSDGSTGSVQARLFSGSPDADRRAENFKGPGAEAFEDRNNRIEHEAAVKDDEK